MDGMLRTGLFGKCGDDDDDGEVQTRGEHEIEAAKKTPVVKTSFIYSINTNLHKIAVTLKDYFLRTVRMSH